MKAYKHEFTKAAADKGWSMVRLAKRWGVTDRQMSNIARCPKQIHWDALSGIPFIVVEEK